VSAQVRLEREGPIGWLIFDHPERRNAIHRAMWEVIPERVATLDADESVRVIVMRGAGDVAFVAGADISEFEQSRIGPGARDYDKLTERAFLSLGNAQKPLIAMIHGFCIGGGSGIALHADMRYAADDAVFAIPPARLGLGYSATNVETLVGVVGASVRARDPVHRAALRRRGGCAHGAGASGAPQSRARGLRSRAGAAGGRQRAAHVASGQALSR
jgi:enoyl-CoA hydratase